MHATLQAMLPLPLVSDGAWGTQLQLAGLAFGECSDSWNLEHPDRVEVVGRSYADAGSEIILTNTLGANRLRLEPQGLADKVDEINRAGVEISKRAAGEKARVFASIGPTGKFLRRGQITRKELREVFAEQVRALAEAGADALLLETFTDLDEMLPGIAAAKETGLPVVASMVFDSGKQEDRTVLGVSPEQAAEAMVEAGADVVGANCGGGIAGYVGVCERMRSAVKCPLWMKPNAGLPEFIDGAALYRSTPEEFVAGVRRLLDAGASFVGGCCGTTPRLLEAVAVVVKARRASLC